MDSTDIGKGDVSQGVPCPDNQQAATTALVSAQVPSRDNHTTDGQEEILPWHVALGPIFTKKVTKKMVTPEGEVIPRWVSVQGESKRKDARKATRLFRYDTGFVVAYLAHWIGPLLVSMPRAELLKLLTQAKATYENKQ